MVGNGLCRHGEKIDWMLQILLVHRSIGTMHHANLSPGFQFPTILFLPIATGCKLKMYPFIEQFPALESGRLPHFYTLQQTSKCPNYVRLYSTCDLATFIADHSCSAHNAGTSPSRLNLLSTCVIVAVIGFNVLEYR